MDAGFAQLEVCKGRLIRWKNGLGQTNELFIDPPGVDFVLDVFDVRISSAVVSVGSDFSMFAVYNRVLIVVEGGGLKLKHGDEDWFSLSPFVVHDFDGAVQTKCELINGPITDLNVIWRKETNQKVCAKVIIGETVVVEKGNFVFVVNGKECNGVSEGELGFCVKTGKIEAKNKTIIIITIN